jgi:maleylacetate reductase
VTQRASRSPAVPDLITPIIEDALLPRASARRFSVHPRQHRVCFGDRVTDVLTQELRSLGTSTPLLIASGRGAAALEHAFVTSGKSPPYVAAYTQVVAHVPDHVAQDACQVAAHIAADCIVAFGGGSALDTAKAVAYKRHIPIVAIPTTLSGSEVTFNFGLTVDGVKQTIVDPQVLPRVVLYDPSLFRTLAPLETLCSGINAIAHATEALYSRLANPLTTSIALTGIECMLRGLRRHRTGPTLDAITSCVDGAWLCGEALAQVGMGLHHRLCHVLGGAFGLPHSRTHAILLPYVVAFNQPSTNALDPLRKLYNCDDVGAGMRRFADELGAPTCLHELGLPEVALGHAVDPALAKPVEGPRAPSRLNVISILQRAWSGADLHG